MARRKELPFTELMVADPNNPALAHPAIAHCVAAWNRTYHAEIDSGTHHVVAEYEAHKVYCYSLPPLTTRKNINDYIACVAFGIAIGAMLPRDTSKLLYAAQVALGSLRNNKKTKQL